MNSPSPLDLQRKTSNTTRRIQNMITIVEELRKREMIAEEIGFLLKYSPSGTRKYIRDLREAGVVEVARHIGATENYIGKSVYAVSQDAGHVKGFLLAITLKKKSAPVKEAVLVPKMPAGSTLHVMDDDMPNRVRIHRKPARRDDLVAALFGATGRAEP